MEKQTKNNKVIFVCAENAGRSQMAEALFNSIVAGNHINWIGESAGTFPASRINPIVIQIMEEKGITIGNKQPRAFLPEKALEYSRIISFGCLVKSAFSKEIQDRIEEWHIEDPKDKTLAEVREIRDEVEQHVNKLIETI